MGLFDKLRAEFIDIIEWDDHGQGDIVHFFNRYQNEIKNGAQLTVREGQVALFQNEGQFADEFGPGRHVLRTANLPILSTLKGWKHGFDSPFKADVIFVSTRDIIDQKWGTANPIMLRDPEFNAPIRLRAFGSYTYRVSNAKVFIQRYCGQNNSFNADQANGQIKNFIVARFADALGESKLPVLDMAANQDELGEKLLGIINKDADKYGIEITNLLVENISLPPEVEAKLDERSSIAFLGNLNDYSQYQSANAMKAAAENPSGSAGEGIGMGMGFAMAQQMANQQMQAQQQPAPQAAPQAPPPPPLVQFHAVINGQQAGPYDLGTLQGLVAQGQITRDTLVWKAGMPNWAGAGTQPELNALFNQTPPPVPPPMP